MAITQTITSIAPAANPATMDRTTFSTTAAANVLAISAMTTELNTWAGQVNAIAGVAVGDVATAIGAATPATPVAADTFCFRAAVGGLLKSISLTNLLAVWKDVTGGLVGLTGFSINFKNAANTFTSFFANANTAARTYTFQDRNGTIADDTDLGTKAALAGSASQNFATNILTMNNQLDMSAGTAGQIAFPATQNASANKNTLDDYDEYTAASAACTGAVTATVIWKLIKIGNTVTLTLPATISAGVAVASFSYGTAIPAKYRPVADVMIISAPIQDNGAAQSAPGAIYITAATGVISVFKNGTLSTNFTVTANAGINTSTGVTWTI